MLENPKWLPFIDRSRGDVPEEYFDRSTDSVRIGAIRPWLMSLTIRIDQLEKEIADLKAKTK